MNSGHFFMTYFCSCREFWMMVYSVVVGSEWFVDAGLICLGGGISKDFFSVYRRTKKTGHIRIT
jgi:hypothetical protein